MYQRFVVGVLIIALALELRHASAKPTSPHAVDSDRDGKSDLKYVTLLSAMKQWF